MTMATATARGDKDDNNDDNDNDFVASILHIQTYPQTERPMLGQPIGARDGCQYYYNNNNNYTQTHIPPPSGAAEYGTTSTKQWDNWAFASEKPVTKYCCLFIINL